MLKIRYYYYYYCFKPNENIMFDVFSCYNNHSDYDNMTSLL